MPEAFPAPYSHLHIQHSEWTSRFFNQSDVYRQLCYPLPDLTCLSLLHGYAASLRNIDRNIGFKCF